MKNEKQRESEKVSGLKFRSKSRSCQNIQSFLAAEIWLCLQTFCFKSSNFLTLITLLPVSIKEKAKEKAQQVTVVHSSHDLIMRGLWVGFSRADGLPHRCSNFHLRTASKITIHYQTSMFRIRCGLI